MMQKCETWIRSWRDSRDSICEKYRGMKDRVGSVFLNMRATNTSSTHCLIETRILICNSCMLRNRLIKRAQFAAAKMKDRCGCRDFDRVTAQVRLTWRTWIVPRLFQGKIRVLINPSGASAHPGVHLHTRAILERRTPLWKIAGAL